MKHDRDHADIADGEPELLGALRARGVMLVRLTFGSLALVVALMGLAVTMSGARLGLSNDTIAIVARALTLTALLNAGVLWVWGRR